jgi:MATE family multidrug resistance protein
MSAAPSPDSPLDPDSGWLAREIAATFALSWPLVVANVAVNLMSTTDFLMLGWLSPEALGAGSLGYNLFLPIFLFGVGVVAALSPLAASMIGARGEDAAGLRRLTHQGLISVVIIAIPCWIVLWNAKWLFLAVGEPTDLASDAATFIHGIQWALAADLFFFAGRSVFAALGRTRPTLIAALVGLGFNALANYALIFGKFGLPAWGLFGSGLATTLAQGLMFALLVGYSFIDPRLRRLRLFAGIWRPHGRDLAALWRLGGPIGLAIVAEVSVFAGSGIVMGLISHAAIEAHAIVLAIASIAFMVPLGLGQAATVRVGYGYGARQPRQISRAGWTALGMTLAYVALSAAIMVAAPKLLISAFIDTSAPENAETVALALSFLLIAAIFQLFDGAQAALANMLRGVHDSRWPLVIALIGYWAIGAPSGLTLAFAMRLGGIGLWIGLAIGLAVVSLMFLIRWVAKERRGFYLPPREAGAKAAVSALSASSSSAMTSK